MLIKRLHCGPEGDLTTSRWPTRLPGDDLRQSLEGVHLLLGQDADQGDHRHRDSWHIRVSGDSVTCITCITWCSDISPSVLMILLTSRLGGVAGWGNYLYWSCIPAVAALATRGCMTCDVQTQCNVTITWPGPPSSRQQLSNTSTRGLRQSDKRDTEKSTLFVPSVLPSMRAVLVLDVFSISIYLLWF